MTHTACPAQRCLVEHLEDRRLLATINVGDWGARPDDGVDDSHAVQRAINVSLPGDTIAFPAGTINIDRMVTLSGDRNYVPAATGATVQFRVAARSFGMTVKGNAANVTISGMKFLGAGIDLGGGTRYSNIRITNNEFSDMSYHAIVQRVYTDTLIITGNVFRNIRAYGVIETYNTDRLNYSYNRVIDSNHGGHILGPRQDVVLSNNYMTGLTDWMLEVQDSGTVYSNNMRIENNVAYDFRKGYGNTGGLSIVNHGDGTIIRNNYLRANFLPGTPFSEGHLHVAIEWNINSRNSTISGNIVGSERSDMYSWQSGVGYGSRGSSVTGNFFYGKFAGGWGGNAKPTNGWDQGERLVNFWDLEYSKMPTPPQWTGPGPTPNPNPTPEPVPVPVPPVPGPTTGPTNLSGVAVGSNRVDLTWQDNTANEIGFKIERSFYGQSGPFVQVALISPNATMYLDRGLPANVRVWYRVRAYTPSGNTAYSNVIMVQTKAAGTGGVIAPVLNSNSDDTDTTPFSDILI